jgi:hypothetical protein
MKIKNPDLTRIETNDGAVVPGRFRMLVMSFLPVFLILMAAVIVWCVGGTKVGMNRECLLAMVLSTVAAGAGSAAITLTWRFWPDYLPQGVLVAMVLRMFITLAGILILALTLGRLGLHFILLIIGFYAIGLISETIMALKITLRRGESEKN